MIATQLEDLQAISLDKTNRLAKMFKRTDNKYVIDLDQFRSLRARIKSEYAVLEISGLRQFSYASCYYDDAFGCYFQHHQKRRQRCKVRTRRYLDCGSTFFEVKLKGTRGLTQKFRTECDFLLAPRIEGKYLDLLNERYRKQYKKAMPFELSPALMVTYQRCTLVALQGSERVTIDYGLQFSVPGSTNRPVRIDNNFIIVETKSKNGKGIADRALKELKIRKAKNYSKYCIGLNLTGRVVKNNNFLATIKCMRRNIVADQPHPFTYGQNSRYAVFQY